MKKYNLKTVKTPKRLKKAQEPAVDLTEELQVATDLLRKQRKTDDADLEYALVTATTRVEVTSVDDEFSREKAFSDQATEAAKEVLQRLEGLGVSWQVPKDFKGEMVKDDKQMAKVRDTLRARKDGLEKSEKMKKLRELKRMGKKIQEEVIRKRSRDKKEFLEKLKKKPVSELFDD